MCSAIIRKIEAQPLVPSGTNLGIATHTLQNVPLAEGKGGGGVGLRQYLP